MTTYTKDNDYTLSAVTRLEPGGTLQRIFNFAAEEVTTILRDALERSDRIEQYSYQSSGGNAVSTSVGVALAVDVKMKNFSAFDSQAEIDLMREKLIELGGKPPGGIRNKSKPGLGG